MATLSSPEKELEACRDTVGSPGEAPAAATAPAEVPAARSDTSAAGSALQGLEGDMAAAASSASACATTSMAGGNRGTGTPSEPEHQYFDPEGGCDSYTEADCLGPKLRSQREGTSGASESSLNRSDPSGQELCQAVIVQMPDDGGGGVQGVQVREPDRGGSRVLRSRIVTFGHPSSASEVSPEVHPEVHSTGRNLRPRATPRVPAFHASPEGGGSRATTQRRSRSRSALRSCSDPQRGSKIKVELEVETNEEQESEQELEPDPAPSSLPQASCSTSRPAVPRRASLPTPGSPPRRPVRMRASSPSPPGRLYPFSVQYSEGARSSSSSSSSEVSDISSYHSFPKKSPGQGSVSGPSPNTLWRALMPDLDNLNSSSSEESEEEIKDAPHSSAVEEM